jgi:hypothetical protein
MTVADKEFPARLGLDRVSPHSPPQGAPKVTAHRDQGNPQPGPAETGHSVGARSANLKPRVTREWTIRHPEAPGEQSNRANPLPGTMADLPSLPKVPLQH